MGIPRYDVLLVFAVTFQAFLIQSKLETWDELKAICVFHLVGFMMELFKTSASISSWQYPNQLGAWSVVHAGKWGAWSLLVVVTFTIVVHLKHIKANVAIAH